MSDTVPALKVENMDVYIRQYARNDTTGDIWELLLVDRVSGNVIHGNYDDKKKNAILDYAERITGIRPRMKVKIPDNVCIISAS